jgi:hypothetical protein
MVPRIAFLERQIRDQPSNVLLKLHALLTAASSNAVAVVAEVEVALH